MIQAGMLKVPEDFYQEIKDWVKRTYAAIVRDDILASSSVEYRKHKKELLETVTKDAQGYSSRIKAKTVPFNVDSLPDNYPKEKMRETLSHIEVRLLPRAGARKRDKWLSGKWEWKMSWLGEVQAIIIIIISDDYVKDIDEYHNNLQKFNKTLRHEIQHAVQTGLTGFITDKAKQKGVPRHQTPLDPDKLNRREKYLLDPDEFYPLLQDRAERLLTQHKGNPSTQDVKDFTEGKYAEEFFEALEKHDQIQWKKAIKELWKFIQDHKLNNVAAQLLDRGEQKLALRLLRRK